RGVTLGAARIELDQLVVRQRNNSTLPVEVLALVEVKRNINDLAHGFHQRQENLAWLTGQGDRYDPKAHRTRSFPTGHFDRNVFHEEAGTYCLLGPGSFRLFGREQSPGLFRDRLYFICRAGAMWGVSAAVLGRIRFRVATDERWQ